MNTISIITITYNDLHGLIKTINSIDNHYILINNYINHIIIDGNSNDGTKDYVNSIIKSRIIQTKFISETDSGIYDAMNKGVLNSSSDYVIFINSGDVLLLNFFSLDLYYRLNNVKDNLNCAGLALSCIYTFSEKKIKIKSRDINLKMPRMPSLHQGIIYKRIILNEIPYTLNFRICGDFENICRIIKKYKFENADIVISELIAGGLSTMKPLLLAKESVSIYKKHFSPNILRRIIFTIKLSISLIAVQSVYYYYNRCQAKL